MLVPYLDNLTSSEEDIVKTITDNEREKMKEVESIRNSCLDKFYGAYGFMGYSEPSIVLDDFLFLGNWQHASNRELLERYQISKLFKYIRNVYSFLRTYFKCL
jgi:hypothetical protein